MCIRTDLLRSILVKLETPALEAMALFAFVIKDARQYLKMINHIQVYEGETLVEQRLEPAHDICFDKRIVYGFLKGRFSIEEMNSFFEDFADCAGVAPEAQGYFQYFNQGIGAAYRWPLHTEHLRSATGDPAYYQGIY